MTNNQWNPKVSGKMEGELRERAMKLAVRGTAVDLGFIQVICRASPFSSVEEQSSEETNVIYSG